MRIKRYPNILLGISVKYLDSYFLLLRFFDYCNEKFHPIIIKQVNVNELPLSDDSF